ncbi:uncharacterized protein KGF55_002650 [Candida pseudojiufengensis]|uniref:uncharacterized protein n=1 Tax=Candida pseudojiufengensis TaxID=497109 RepID=UPI002223F7A0|nr:uncharacterized protein KGF55_002650 [Candida pseudojiufengensis]KAI5963770.1 hypothetical protein KGF55_002650 [Candida pseudojiufengensis]
MTSDSLNSQNKSNFINSLDDNDLSQGRTSDVSHASQTFRSHRSHSPPIEDLPLIDQEITDSEDEDEFIRKYGDIQFQYIKPPKDNVWFIKPHALNYFKDGILFRTKGERGSSRTELFLDLLYVGLIANLAGEATEEANGLALLKYFLFFMPIWTVWADIKDFTNYYYNEDLSQKLYIFWILCLLTLYINSHYDITESYSKAAVTIVPYMLCRLSLAASLVVYSFFIPEHRPQQRLYAAFIVVLSLCWLSVIFVSVRVKIALSIVFFFLEQVTFVFCYHPFVKRLMGLTMSTALNIEHEVERFSTFVTIAIGEYLYKVVATGPLGVGFSGSYARGVFLLADAYILFWLYQYRSHSRKATHPLRRSGTTAILWVYAHLPLIAALVLSADAGGELCAERNTSTKKHQHHSEELHERAESSSEEEKVNMYGLSFYYTGGITVSLLSMFVLGFIEKSNDPPGLFIFSKFWRIIWRIPIAIIIVMISFAEMNSTLLMGIVTLLLAILLVFESIVSTPRNCLFVGKQPTVNTV